MHMDKSDIYARVSTRNTGAVRSARARDQPAGAEIHIQCSVQLQLAVHALSSTESTQHGIQTFFYALFRHAERRRPSSRLVRTRRERRTPYTPTNTRSLPRG